uniref:Reverse transcriptase n=1 Tax=Phytophthora ramorum TaxID=164328 RepID=H3GL48_PHYRM
MPKFLGTKEDDVGDYMFSAKLYFESKNIKYGGTSRVSKTTSPLSEASSAMSDIDKVMHFQKGLLTDIKQEVKLRQFSTTTEAISFALMYDHTHFVSSRHQSSQRRSSPQLRQRIEEQPTSMEIGNARIISREECMRRNLCLYCKEPGHRLADCRKRQARNSSRDPSRPPHGRSSFRANQNSFRHVVEAEDGPDGEEDFVDDNDNLVEVTDSLQLNMVSVDSGAPSKRELRRFEGMVNDQVVRVLIDSGAERNIVRPGLAQHFVDAAKVTAEHFDGTTTPARTAHRCCETLSFDGRDFADVSLFEWEVSSNQDVILGHPWLVQFNPIISWQTGVMRIPRPRLVLDARSINDSLDVAPPALAAVEVTSKFLQHPLPSNLRQQLDDHVKAGYFICHWVQAPLRHLVVGRRLTARARTENEAATSLCVISAAQFATKVKAETYVELYHVTVKEPPNVKTVPPQLQAVVEEFADVFPAELPPGLPPQRSIEHEVIVKPGAKPSNRAPFRLSKAEQEALDIFVAELLKKNWIEVSDSPWMSNIFGVPKKDPTIGKFPSRLEWLHSNNPHMAIRWVIDYRLVNAASEVAKIPLPHIEQLFDRMVGAVAFTILDLASGYHQMRMAPTSKQYTAFRTNQEIYHWNVAPMGLAGMPATWTRLMHNVLSHLAFVVVYLDDICIFSRSMADHVEHLQRVCEVLRQHQLVISASALLIFLATRSRSTVYTWTRAIAEWMEPSNIKDLQRFLGLVGYYHRFIHRFATLVLPLSALVKMDVPWAWDDTLRLSFNAIKLTLQHPPVLRLPDFDRPFIVTTDAGHACTGGVLSQLHDGSDIPVAFFSKKLGPHELNWPFTLHHRPGAMNVIADALSRPPGPSSSLGEGQDDNESKPVTVSLCAACRSSPTCTDIRQAASRRTKTTEKIRSIPTRDQDVILAVKKPVAELHDVGTAQLRMRVHAFSTAGSTVISSLQLDTQTKKAFQKAYDRDPEFKHLWKYGRTSEEYEVVHGLVYLKSNDNLRRLCVPNNRKLRVDVIHNAHDAAIMAHPGIRRTQLAAAQWYFWPSMDLDIKSDVQSCESCMRYKSSMGRKTGKLQPIPLPAACWEVVSTDFITHLPVSDGFDAIMVVVDKLSKRPVYIPTHTTATAEDTAKLFFNNVIRYYGIPSTIISDRDPKFTSRFWTALVNLMMIKAAMTSAHRAQADGQTERQNRTLEDSLRCSISYHGNDWNEHLPMIEYAHATLVSSSSKLSPFFVDTGRKPTYLLDTGADAASVPHSRVEHASRFVQHRQEVIERARKNLLDAHATQKKFYDKRRAENPFKVGDLALLSTQDLKISHATAETTLRSRKFIPRFIGPYAILEIRGNVALLDLPANLKSLSPRFNIDKLKVYTSNPDRFDGRMISKSTPVIFDDDGEPLHVVEALIKRRTFNRQPEYLVKWYGLPHHENTWERERDIKHVSRWQALLKDLCRRSQARACGILFMRGFPVMFLTTRDYGTTNFNFDDFILKVLGLDQLGGGGECNDLQVQKQSDTPSPGESAQRAEIDICILTKVAQARATANHSQPLHVQERAPSVLVAQQMRWISLETFTS